MMNIDYIIIWIRFRVTDRKPAVPIHTIISPNYLNSTEYSFSVIKNNVYTNEKKSLKMVLQKNKMDLTLNIWIYLMRVFTIFEDHFYKRQMLVDQ